MEAIAPDRSLKARLQSRSARLLTWIIFLAAPIYADRAADVRAQIGRIATALSSGNPADAMVPFDKSFKDYEKLKGYFEALARYQLSNEVDVTDEEDSETETTISVHWTMTLADLGTNTSEERAADLKIRLVARDAKCTVVDLSPVDFFNPATKK